MSKMEKHAKTARVSHPGDLGSAWIGICAGLGMVAGIILNQLVWGLMIGAAAGTVLFAVLASQKTERSNA
jgi:hypothetical protein